MSWREIVFVHICRSFETAVSLSWPWSSQGCCVNSKRGLRLGPSLWTAHIPPSQTGGLTERASRWQPKEGALPTETSPAHISLLSFFSFLWIQLHAFCSTHTKHCNFQYCSNLILLTISFTTKCTGTLVVVHPTSYTNNQEWDPMSHIQVISVYSSTIVCAVL